MALIVVFAAMPVPVTSCPTARPLVLVNVTAVLPLVVVVAADSWALSTKVPGPDFTRPMAPVILVLIVVVFWLIQAKRSVLPEVMAEPAAPLLKPMAKLAFVRRPPLVRLRVTGVLPAPSVLVIAAPGAVR